MTNVVTVVGARPQFIKAGTVSRAFARTGFEEVLVHTGQHFDHNMSEVFFEQLDLPIPRYNLRIGGGTHGQMTGRTLEGVETVLLNEKPDLVLVYGDTNATLAGALAASKIGMRVAHVEAGLRSWNRTMPEEINRVVVDHISDLLFAPTPAGVENLRTEGIAGEKVHLVGDVMFDAARFYRDRARRPEADLPDSHFVLCTVHRPQNTEDPARLRGIVEGLVASEAEVVWPVHPRMTERLAQLSALPRRIHLVEPMGYLEMVWLESHCARVATDSGGVQKEAFFHGKPCVLFREETEWVELVEAGYQRLVGANPLAIVEALRGLSMPERLDGLYGHGDAAERIVEVLAAGA